MTKLNELLAPVPKRSGPAALNTVPLADYLAPRIDSIGAFYANGSSVVAHSDDVGRYGRFSILVDPANLLDQPVKGNCGSDTDPPPLSYCYNAYPQPRDAADNQPFSGQYPRLFPYDPPSRKSVLP